MSEKKSQGFQILKTLYENRLDPGMIYFPKKNKDDDKSEFAKKLCELGYIRYKGYIKEETNRTEGFYAAIEIPGIEYFEKIEESKTKSLQTWMIVGLTVYIFK